MDNLDRANEDNIVFLFKLISIVFDLPHTVYVLSFERERIDAILCGTQELDDRFIEKIIQQEIKVPAISDECKNNTYVKCLCNLFEAYGIQAPNWVRFQTVIKTILKQSTNLRAFKRFVNSVLSLVFCEDNMLDKRDLLAIETIRFFAPELYICIYTNRRFFVSHELLPSDSLERSFNIDGFNKECGTYLTKVLSEYPGYKDLLQELFPYVHRHVHKYEIISKYSFSDPDYEGVVKGSRICSGKYFDLYFSYGSNDYLVVRQQIETFVDDINKSATAEEINLWVRLNLIIAKEIDQKEWLERLQNYLSDIDADKGYMLALSFIEYIDDITSNLEFWALNARQRAEYIISRLLMCSNNQQFEDFVESMKDRYDLIELLHQIEYWFEHEEGSFENDIKKRAEQLAELRKQLCAEIVKNTVSIYEDPIYRRGNVWEVYQVFNEAGKQSAFADYIKKIFTPQYVYKALWDCVRTALGSVYMYSINEERLKVLAVDCELIDHALEEMPPRNESEEFVCEIYQLYKKEGTDPHGEKSIKRNQAVDIVL